VDTSVDIVDTRYSGHQCGASARMHACMHACMYIYML
jgi:hypothetical protein